MAASWLACVLLASIVTAVPEFLGPSSRITYLDENSLAGTSVLTVHAMDEDGSSFTFSLMPTDQFSIGSTSGVVEVATGATLDREVTASISLTISLIDSTGATVAPSLPVTVYLNDINDNLPVWRNPITALSSPLPEDTSIGDVIYIIVTSDADLGQNGDIRFRIQSPTDGTFAVNEISGVVTLARSLDADAANSLTIMVLAEDEGSPSLSTTVSFTVSIAAVVPPAPMFTQTHYFVTINEGDYTSANLNNLITVVAVAADDASANIVYSKVNRGVPSDAIFDVANVGVVNVVGNLDRESASSYDVQIQAHITSNGLPNSASGSALVTVTLLDINDNDPVFENPHPDSITLIETTPASTIVYTFYATDADQGTNGDITFELISPANGPFSIGATSGAIHLAGALSHNTNPTYTITVRARDGATPPRTSTSSLMITVADVVTAPPTFTQNVYTFEVEEGSSYTDYQVGVVRAVDAENPLSAIRYQRITRGDASDTLFSVSASGASAGRIALTGAVDRETTNIYSISITAFRVASDGATDRESEVGIASVIIIIADANDQSPVWTTIFSPFTISESQPIGTDIFTATATDADSGSNGRVTYSFVSSPADLPFTIDGDSGVIRLSRVLDFDTQSSFTLTVRAQDGGTPANFITNMLVINVQDVLDLPPTFTETAYSIEVAERLYSNEIVGTVRAQETTRPNAVIRYEKVSGNAIFTVTSSGTNAGAVVLTGTVDAERVDTYVIIVRAFRVTVGTTARSGISTVSVVVTIGDINDNDPIWTDPTPGPITLIETRPLGTNVYTVKATDADSGTNGEVIYSLPPPVAGPFSIGASSGIIRLAGPLDFIEQSQYSLSIRARDGAIPSRNITTTLTIDIVDVLDPAPIFTESIYTESIIEAEYTNQLVGTVRAIDPLNPAAAIIRYEEVEPGHSLFQVVSSGNSAGQVLVTGLLDREATSTYAISIRAFRVADDSSTTPLSDTSVVSMLITVSDANDNAPIFLNPVANPISVLETRSVGTILHTFHASDLDSGSNGEITFSLESPLDVPFAVDSGSGVVRIQGILDYDIRTSYTLIIRAQDSGTDERFTDTTLVINLVDVLDPPPAFSLREYNIEVAEGMYTDHLVGTVQAVDMLHPTTAEIRYRHVLKGDATDNLFRVIETGMTAGDVFLTGTVDLSVESYSINIQAFRVLGADATPRSGISTVTMTITITDINDNPPVILNPRTTPISLLETRPLGTVVYSYHAVDPDLGSNGMITFSITPSGTPFSIDPTGGVVRLTSRLDFNVAESYALTITAQDGGDTVQSAITVLNIVIVDVTDPPPSFSLSDYTFTVNEGLSNVVVGRVIATDRVSPQLAIIRYQQVTKGDVTDSLFSVDETGANAGDIRILSAADREAISSYIISVRAFRVHNSSDATPMSGISIVPVTITIGDVNDNPPTILNPTTGALSIFETRLAGSIIYTVFATDIDEGSNGDITYSLTSPADGPFSIDASTGIIRLTSVLDFDSASSYTLEVCAQDGGAPVESATTSITVNVVDIQDPPPTFSASIYYADLDEGTYSNQVVLTVVAVDSLHPTATIRYEQIMKGDSTDSLFSVINSGEDAGQVTVTGNLDREADAIHTMNIRAFRVSSATSSTARSSVSVVTLVLTVVDTNDNPPVWLNPTTQAIPIVETAQVGTVVYSLIISDADEDSNGRATFTIQSPTNGVFAVNQGGVVTLAGMLNVDTTPSYTVQVLVLDQGTPSNMLVIMLDVQVTAAAAAPPVFVPLVYTVSAAEADYTASPLRVTDVTATPNTVGGVISYSTQSRDDGSHTPFTVNAANGAVFFTGQLDRETQQTWSVNILATEVDSTTSSPIGSNPAIATVILRAADINDNAPTFVTDHIVGSIPESARIGDVAAAGVRAFDLDEGTNAAFSYFISSTPAVPFAVNAITGVVTLNGPLDYEMQQSYQFSIEARETSTSEQRSSVAVVNIIVQNDNDNLPVFGRMEYRFQVSENSVPGPLISTTPAGLGAITASDADRGVLGDVTYSLLGFGVPERFSVSTLTGIISTTTSLDYEERAVYHLTLVARDGGGTLTTPNQANTLIIIEVLDVNDHTPQCFPLSTTVTLQENTAFPNFLTISAIDGDPPNTANSRLSFSIASSPLFTIDATNGQISASELDYEAVASRMYGLRVTVSDAGTPAALSATCLVTVNVRDSNDAAPQFTQNVYTSTITEIHPVGNPVGIIVQAADPEPHHTITYFTESSDSSSAFFSVDGTSGMVSLAHAVDYDLPARHRQFSFRVLAIDDATPPLTGTATVMVNIAPENDNAPVISNPPARDPLNRTLVEDLGTTVPLSLFSVDASDIDGDALIYNFTTTNNFLSIDSTNGDITLVSTLDREIQSSHAVGIQVCDPGMRCSFLLSYITVADYNDHPPIFGASSLAPNVSIRECDVMDQNIVVTVLATDTVDLDSGHQAVTYAAVGGDTSRFSVGEETGVVRMVVSPAVLWDFEVQPNMYSLTVRATDFPAGMPRLSSPMDSVLTLTLTDCNDFPTVFASSTLTFNINETTVGPPSNMVVYTGVTATDGDATSENRERVFSIVDAPASTNGWFGIDRNTGSIHIIGGAVVDREHNSLTIDSMGRGVMSFNILVVNAATTGTFSSTAMMTVAIHDINDNPPVIQQRSPVMVTVLEHSAVGTLITVITAVDVFDYGDNTHVVYEIISGNEDSKFAINTNTGIVTVLGDLDTENRSQYQIRVQAREDLGRLVTTPDVVDVTITVIDTNDHSPMFDLSSYTANLQEFNSLTNTSAVSVSQVVTVIHAIDRDGPGTAAGRVEYSITSGAVQFGVEMFRMEPSTGVVTVLRPDLLDYEGQQQFAVTVEAHDLVTPETARRHNSTQLIISVENIDDNVPMFLSPMYTGSVLENQPVGTEVAVTPTILGRDADGGQLTFLIITGQPFAISSDGRNVTTTAVLDREALIAQSYMLSATLQVMDTAGHITSTTLTITIANTNDNPPCFPPTTLAAFSVEENRAIFPDNASFIGMVQAEDPDFPLNPQITYFLSDGGKFRINSTTGEVFVREELNREETAFYTLNVTSTDGELECGIQLSITILETNDNDPIFNRNPYLGSVIENADIGTTVDVNFTTTNVQLQVVATDIDRDPSLTYTVLAQSGPPVPFAVDAQTGYITTNATLDREAVDRYTFMVEVHDGLRSSNTLVEIIVQDFNDNSPVFLFSGDTVNITIPELTPANFVFLFIEATDADIGSNAEIAYSLVVSDPPSAANLFNISETRGGVFATEDIELNEGDAQVITIAVTASNPPSSTPALPPNVIVVTINIEPQNINAPNFTTPHYNFAVPENQNGSVIGTVLAVESSGDVGTVITYSIFNSGGTEASNFMIDSITGSIVNINSFDRESIDLYQFSVRAQDNAPQPRFGFTTVSVRVMDENDNAPVSRFPSYPITVSETVLPNTTFLTVFTSDADIGPNGEISYSIVEGNTSAFAIDALSGGVRTLLPLDREGVEFYPVTVSAEDNGSPSTTTNVSVLVTIGDVNDNDPYFISGAVLRNQSVEVYENSPPNTNITFIGAADEDANGNARIVYTFPNFALTSGPFQISRTTGLVFVRSDGAEGLDRERQDFYEVTVVASDQGGTGPEIRSTPATFSVRLLDVNDSVPIFTELLFDFEVKEDYPVGVVFGAVTGDDNDIGSNAILFYHILGDDLRNTTCSGKFCINHTSGELSLQEMLDTETQPVHTVALAINNQMQLLYNLQTEELINATRGTARVEALDANDEAPVFIQRTLFAAVEENAEFGTSVAKLEATDVDTGNGSVIWFGIDSPNAPFVVDQDTGVVTTAGVFRGLSGETIDVQVRAFDNFGVSPTEFTIDTLSVLVFRCGEQIELSFSEQREVVERGIDRITGVLTEVTNARIIISNVNVRQTIAGTVDITGTDVKFFALNPEARRVLSPAAIIRVIDENYGIVESVFEEYGILEILIEPCEDPTPSPINTLPNWLWVIIGILILALCCLCCCCILICIGEKRKSRQWKHKVIKSEYDSQMEQFQMSGFGQENPIWIDPFYNLGDSTTSMSAGDSATDRENPLYESQELTIEMFQDTMAHSDNEEEEVDAPVYESQELLLEMFSDNLSSEGGSQVRLMKPPRKDKASPLNQDTPNAAGDAVYESQEILYEMYSEDMSESGSQAHLVKAPRKTAPRNRDMDDMLEKALDDSDADSDSTIAYI